MGKIKVFFGKAFTFFDIAFTPLIFLLSKLTPRDPYTWVFIGWHRSSKIEIFADNTKYLFLYTHKNLKRVKPVWLAKDRTLAALLRERGYNSYYEHSLKGIYYALRAKYTFLDAFLQRQNYRLTGRGKIMQLLHGKGMKKKGYDEVQLRPQDYIFAPSQFVIGLLPSSFTIKSKILVTGYSRSDEIYADIEGSDISVCTETLQSLKEKKEQEVKTLWYAPTFRRGQKVFDIEKVLEVSKLSAWLKEKNLHLYISLHPKYRDQARSASYENISFFEDSDVYPLMKYFDIQITDYSSSFTDYILLDRPIIFYPYDIEDYTKNEGFSFDYDSHTPGPKAYDPKGLRDQIENVLTEDKHTEARKEIRDLYHDFKDAHSSRRIIDAIEKEEGLTLS